MRTTTQRLNRAISGTAAVLVVGMLLVQHVPMRPLAHRLAGGPEHGCTEQRCRCGADCACAHCAHHAANPSEATRSASDSGEDLTLRSCGGASQGPLGAFVVAKSLVAPGLSAARPPRLAATAGLRLASLVPQRQGDDIFRPPKRPIG